MFMCRQTDNLWCKLIHKGREKKGERDVLMQKKGEKHLLHLI